MCSIPSVNVLRKSKKFFEEVDKQSGSTDEFGTVKTKMVRSFSDELLKGNYCAALVIHIGLYIFGFGLGTKAFFIEGFHSDANVQPHDLKESLDSGLASLCIKQWKRPESGKGRRPLVWGQGIDVGTRINNLWSGKVTSLVDTYKHVGGREFFDKKWPGGEGLDEVEKGQRLLSILYPKAKEEVNKLSESDVSATVNEMNKIVEQSICPDTDDLRILANVNIRWSMDLLGGKFYGTTSEIVNKIRDMLGQGPEELELRIFKQPEKGAVGDEDPLDSVHNDSTDHINEGDKHCEDSGEGTKHFEESGKGTKHFEESGEGINGDISESGDSDDVESNTSTATPKIVAKLQKRSQTEVTGLNALIDIKAPEVHSNLSDDVETSTSLPRAMNVLGKCMGQNFEILRRVKTRLWMDHFYLGIAFIMTELESGAAADVIYPSSWTPKKASDHRNAARMTMSLYVRICNETCGEEVSLFILLMLSETKWTVLRNTAQTMDTAERFINDIVDEVKASRSRYDREFCRGFSILRIVRDFFGASAAWTDIYGRTVNAKAVLDSIQAPTREIPRHTDDVTKKRTPSSSEPKAENEAVGKKKSMGLPNITRKRRATDDVAESPEVKKRRPSSAPKTENEAVGKKKSVGLRRSTRTKTPRTGQP